MPKIKILRGCVVDGIPRDVGETVEASPKAAEIVKAQGQAEDAPAETRKPAAKSADKKGAAETAAPEKPAGDPPPAPEKKGILDRAVAAVTGK